MRRTVRSGLLVIVGLLLLGVLVSVPAFQAQDDATTLEEPSPENLFQVFLRELRTDVEILADRVYGGGTRPDTWIGNTDFRSQSMLADLFIDNELLADEIFGAGERPRDWISASSTVADLVGRNIRHDLELAADEWIGEDVRPDDWIGGPRLFQCDRSLMNIVYLLDIGFGIRPETPETVLDYCTAIRGEVEDVLLAQAVGENQIENVQSLVLAVRGDLERLADEVLGVNERPDGWIDNTDPTSATFELDLSSDLELLADIILQGLRPDTWVEGTSANETSTLRNLRFNLELLADRALGVGRRPTGWQGESEIFRCDPLVQSLVVLTERVYDYQLPQTDATGPDFCRVVDTSVNLAVENPPPPEVQEELAADEEARLYTAESRNAFAYLDVAALQFMGPMPWGTEFRAWYRNYNQSNMMFVSGLDFAVYIDRRFTTMPEDIFDTLPTLDGVVPLTFCDAGWCNGPRATPTPTGSGPLLDIINANTPPAEVRPFVTPDADTTGKRQVTWNYIRINYLLNRPDAGAYQVALEICTEPNQIVCEPVIEVFNLNTNSPVSVISTFNGLNVYELPYGYTTNFNVEGETLFSTDIWINDPSIQEP